MKLIARGQDVSCCMDVDRVERVGREIMAYRHTKTENGLNTDDEVLVGYFNLDGLYALWTNEVNR